MSFVGWPQTGWDTHLYLFIKIHTSTDFVFQLRSTVDPGFAGFYFAMKSNTWYACWSDNDVVVGSPLSVCLTGEGN